MAGQHISDSRINEILAAIRDIHVLAVGDIRLDFCWHADMRLSKLSHEAPHFPLPIVDERITFGAGGNVVANLCALSPERVAAIGLVGDDWRGSLARHMLDGLNVDTRALYGAGGFSTFARCKPILGGLTDATCEGTRIEFVNASHIDIDAEDDIVSALMGAAGCFEAIAVSDQLINGCVTRRVREALSALGASGELVVVGSGDNVGGYRNVAVAQNEIEAEKALGPHFFQEHADAPPETAAADQAPGRHRHSDYLRAADVLARRCSGKAVVTLCEGGSVFSDGARHERNIPWRAGTPKDIAIAGEAFIAAYACALAVKASCSEAADFASLCSSVAAGKTDGASVALPDEVMEAGRAGR